MKKSEIFEALDKTIERQFEQHGPEPCWYSLKDIEGEPELEPVLKKYDKQYEELFGDNFEQVVYQIERYYCELYIAERLEERLEELEIETLNYLSSFNEYSSSPPKLPQWIKDKNAEL